MAADDDVPVLTAESASQVTRNRSMRQKLADWYLVYEIRTALYSLEPWEKALFNSCLVLFLSMGCYTGYRFLPGYATSLLKYLSLM